MYSDTESTELTPDQPPVTLRREPHKRFKCNCSLLAGGMLLNLPEVQGSICSNSIFRSAQKHGKKRQTTMCEDVDSVETGREAGHSLTFTK